MKIRFSAKCNKLGVIALIIIGILYEAYRLAVSDLPKIVLVCYVILMIPIVLILKSVTQEIVEAKDNES